MSSPEAPQRPSRSLSGKVAIVTGAGSAGDGIGNGRATSILLAEAGASVVCVDSNEGNARRTVSMIEEEGLGKAISIKCDVTIEEECKAVVAAAISTFGRLDILVNNVGILGPKGTAVDTDMAEWAKGLEINVTSMVLMARHAIPEMEKNTGPCRGSIVLLGSVAGIRGGTTSLLYPVSKGRTFVDSFSVVQLARAMASHHAAQGIRVNSVSPGMLYTPMMYANGMSEEDRATRRQRSLLKTEGNAFDCAASVRFLASDEARWITGTNLIVDAGATSFVGIELGQKS